MAAGKPHAVGLPPLDSTLRVVLYHHIDEGTNPLVSSLDVCTPPELFEEHLAYYAKNYDIVSLGDVLEGPLPKRPLLLTFDDAYRSVLDVAAPMLKARSMPAAMFVATEIVRGKRLMLDNLLSLIAAEHGLQALWEAIGGTGEATSIREMFASYLSAMPYEEERIGLNTRLTERFGVDHEAVLKEQNLYLEPSDIKRLVESGFELGGHTANHVHCRTLRESELDVEINEPVRLLEEWGGRKVRSFSYPFGGEADHTAAVRDRLISIGTKAIFLVHGLLNRRGQTSDVFYRVSMTKHPVSVLGRRIELAPRIRMLKRRALGEGSWMQRWAASG